MLKYKKRRELKWKGMEDRVGGKGMEKNEKKKSADVRSGKDGWERSGMNRNGKK